MSYENVKHQSMTPQQKTAKNGLLNFVRTFKNGKPIYLEDSVLWYCLDLNIDWYLTLTINQRINFKASY